MPSRPDATGVARKLKQNLKPAQLQWVTLPRLRDRLHERLGSVDERIIDIPVPAVVNAAAKSTYKHTMRLYLRHSRPYWRYGITALISAPTGELLTRWLPPLVVAYIIDQLAVESRLKLEAFLPLVGAYALMQFAGELVFFRFCIWNQNRFTSNSMQALAGHAYDNFLDRNQHFHNNNFSGSLVARLNRFVVGFEQLFETALFDIVTTAAVIIFTAVVLWGRSPLAVLAFLAIASLYLIAVQPLIRRQARLNRQTAEQDSRANGHLADSLANVAAIKSFAHEDFEKDEYRQARRRLVKRQLRGWDFQNIPTDILTSFTVVSINSLALLGALIATIQFNQNPSTIFLIISYMSALTQRLWNMRRIIRRIEQILTDASEMTQTLMEPLEMKDAAKPQKLRLEGGAIRFRDVTFRFRDGGTQPLFKDFNLDIKPGERIGLVGQSGSGKTTLIRLVMRMMDIGQGTIEIDGQPIADVSQAELRAAIAYVPQEPVLFHRTIMENIRYGRLDATDEEVMAAADLAHAHNFIMRMPDGYESTVGERGTKLSGGQRQRIAIARAILKQAPILILDEATSALDSRSEHLLQDALWKLMEGRTTLVVAHRLSTIQQMDRILVFKQGTIVEQGTHDALLKRKDGVYANLWAHQSGNFIEP